MSIRFRMRVEVGDGKSAPAENMVKEMNILQKDVNGDLQLKE